MQDRVQVKLKQESWDNIFRVLAWCAPMTCTNEVRYQRQNEEHFSLGGFWAQIHEAQRQVEATE